MFFEGDGNEPAAAAITALAEDLGYLQQEFPIRALLWHKDDSVITGDPLARTASTTMAWGHYAEQSAAADGDSFAQAFILAAGTYTVHWWGRTDNTSGKLDWDLDGTTIKQGQDWFSASPAGNVEKTASVTVAETGRHVLTGTVNGKNAGSSGYGIKFVACWFEPAEDVT